MARGGNAVDLEPRLRFGTSRPVLRLGRQARRVRADELSRRRATVERVLRIVIYMHWRDHNPAHFHAIYGGEEALVVIDDGTLLAGSLPRTAARLVSEWTQLRRDDLVANWECAQVPDPLLPVDPLQLPEPHHEPSGEDHRRRAPG